jgi:hypothetical protein
MRNKENMSTNIVEPEPKENKHKYLIKLAREGNAQAAEILFREYGVKVYTWVEIEKYSLDKDDKG